MTVSTADAADREVPDVFDPRGYADGLPHAAYRLLRDRYPVAWQEEPEVLGWPAGPGFWAVTRHQDVVRVLKDARTFSSHLGATQIRDPDPADLPFIRRMMLNQDPPDHGRLRRAVSRAFTPRRIDRFGTVIRERARALLTAAVGTARAGDGASDLVTAVTDDFALLNLADLLGVPAAERGLLLDWTRRVIGYQDPDEAGPPASGPDGRPANPRSPALLQDMFDFARELAAHKRRCPGDDVMTVLASDPELATPELEMFFFLLTVAGNDTVRSAAPADCWHWPGTRTRTAGCARAPWGRRRPWRSCCAGIRRCSASAVPRPTTPNWPAAPFAPATRWWSSTVRRITTSGSSPTRTAWTWPGPPIPMSLSATGRMSAWAPISPGCNCGCCTRRPAVCCPPWRSPVRRSGWYRTSSMG